MEDDLDSDKFYGLGPKVEAAATRMLREANGFVLGGVAARMFDISKFGSCDIDMTVERYWANYVREYVIGHVERIYSHLVKNKYTEKKPYVHNDAEDRLWYIPDSKKEGRRIICNTSQSLHLLFIWDKKARQFHIRRFYQEYEPSSKLKGNQKRWQEDDEQGYKDAVQKHGFTWAIRHSDELEKWSDDIENNLYPHRPSLSTFKKQDFVPKYGDGRDKGYVLTYRAMDNSVHSAIGHHSLIKLVLDSYIPAILVGLFDESFKGDTLSRWKTPEDNNGRL